MRESHDLTFDRRVMSTANPITDDMKLITSLALLPMASMILLKGQAAEPYHFEGDVGYGHVSTDQTDIDDQVLFLGGSWYPTGVSRSEGPRDEADFLGHAAYVSGYGDAPWSDADRPLIGRETFSVDPIAARGVSFGLSGQYAHPTLPVTVGAGFQIGSVADDTYDFELKTANWTVNAGWWALRNAVVGLRYTALNHRMALLDAAVDDHERNVEAYGKLVQALTENQSLNVEVDGGQQADESDGERFRSWEAGLAVDWYITSRYSVGNVFRFLSGENKSDEGVTYGARASAWFTDAFGVRAGLSRFDARDDAASDDETRWYAEVCARF